jgi:hypothetical protein
MLPLLLLLLLVVVPGLLALRLMVLESSTTVSLPESAFWRPIAACKQSSQSNARMGDKDGGKAHEHK